MNVGLKSFRPHSIPVRCGNTRFRGWKWGNFVAILEYAGMADSKGCERNSFILKANDILLATFERTRKTSCPPKSGSLRQVPLEMSS